MTILLLTTVAACAGMLLGELLAAPGQCPQIAELNLPD